MDDWSRDLSPESPLSAPPKMMDMKGYEIWDADQTSLASLPDPASDPWPACDDDHTFSSDLSLGARVESTLQCSVPKNVLSHHLREKVPLSTLHPNRPWNAKSRTEKSSVIRFASESKEVRLTHDLELVKVQLAEAKARIDELTTKSLFDDEEIVKLKKTIEVQSAANTRLVEENDALHSNIETELKRFVSQEAETKKSQASADFVKEELQSCRADLDGVRTRLLETETELTHSKSMCRELEAQLTQRPSYDTSAIREMRKSKKDLHSRVRTLEAENVKLQKESDERMQRLDCKSQECSSLTNEIQVLHRKLENRPQQDALTQTESMDMISVANQTESTTEFDHTSFSNRLASAREAEDRPSLIRQYHDEIRRLVLEYEQNTSELEKRHAQSLQVVEDQAADEIAMRVQHMRRSLTSEHQKHLDQLKRRCRSEVNKIREERDRTIASMTDLLEVTQAQVTATTQQLEEESQKYCALEGTLDALRLEVAREKIILSDQYLQELQAAKLRAAAEKSALLENIERGCSGVISESRRFSMGPHSTRAHASQFQYGVGQLQEDRLLANSITAGSGSTPSTPGKQVMSRESYHEIPDVKQPPSLSQSLAETEAMVMKVLRACRS